MRASEIRPGDELWHCGERQYRVVRVVRLTGQYRSISVMVCYDSGTSSHSLAWHHLDPDEYVPLVRPELSKQTPVVREEQQ